jgi:hypothetical protein
VSLPVIATPPGATAPILYAGYTLGQPAVRFTPHAPEGTAAVMYSLDGGGYYPSPVTASASRARTPRGFRFEGTPASGEVRLEIRSANGDAVGPFRYDAAPAASLILNTMKASLEADLYGLIRCTRLNFSFDQKSLERARTASDATQRREAGRITSALESEGLSSVQRGPAVACRPDWQAHSARTRNYLGDWAAVRELHFGVRSGRLGTNVRNPLEIEDALANRIPRSREFGRLWTAVLPADAEGVYVRLEFRDGSSSEEFRVPITDLALPGPP